jgi:uncharacterized damage-inducible protein DinB
MLRAIERALARSISGDAWYGPSLELLLADVTPEEAVAHPIAGAHSIQEVVLHVGAWLGEVASRLRGNAPSPPEAGDWPRLEGDPASSWPRARARVVAADAEVRAAIGAFSETRLDESVGDVRDAPLGTGVSFEAMLMGLAQHNAYHAGQIALLKRAARTSRGARA